MMIRRVFFLFEPTSAVIGAAKHSSRPGHLVVNRALLSLLRLAGYYYYYYYYYYLLLRLLSEPF
jgi:hypothetical protein